MHKGKNGNSKRFDTLATRSYNTFKKRETQTQHNNSIIFRFKILDFTISY